MKLHAIGSPLAGVASAFVPNVATAGNLVFADNAAKIIPGLTSLSWRNNADTFDNFIILDNGHATFLNQVNATTFVGALTGNASTATALANIRTINGTNFDGTANITVTAAAGTLTGATLNATVLASSLTSVGILASPHFTSPVIDSGGLTATGPNTFTGTVTAGGATLLTLSPAAHGTVVAETNAILVNAQTITITGGYSVQRFALFNQPTVTAGSALTVATAATVAIANAPTPGGSGLVTRPIALWVQNGQVGIDSASGLSTATTANVGPAVAITGTWITGGSATTNKPHVLIEPSGTTSTGWVGTAGTALGINAASGFTGRFIDGQVAGVSTFNVLANGTVTGAALISTGVIQSGSAVTMSGGTSVNLLTLTHNASTSGNRVLLTATAGAHTGQTIAEETDVNFNLARTLTFTAAGSTIATNRAFLIQAPTYAAASGSQTITNAATLAISAAPTQGTNVVLTNTWSLWVQAGAVAIDAKIGRYNSVATTGMGVPAIYASTTTGTITNATTTIINAFAVPAADSAYEIAVSVNVTASATAAMTVTISYTDVANTARVATVDFNLLTGVSVQSITTAQGNIDYSGVMALIRCKASTTITIATAGTVTGIQYTAMAIITQLA